MSSGQVASEICLPCSHKIFEWFFDKTNEPTFIYTTSYSCYSMDVPVPLSPKLYGDSAETPQASASHSGMCHSMETLSLGNV